MRSSLLSKLYCLATIILLATQAGLRAQVYNPIALTPGSYTQSIIVPQTATNTVPLCDAVTATMEGGTNNANDAWYEEGYDTAAPTTGLPHPGGTISTNIAPSVPITWGTPVTCSAAADVSTNGALLAAYCWDETAPIINGVTFTKASTTANAQNGTYILTSGMSGGEYNGYGGGTTAPFSTLPSGYQTMLSGGVYSSSTASTATVTLTGLTPGRSYLVQIWVNDSRSCCDTRADLVSAGGGNTITLDFNAIDAAGGVGQFTIGTFTANATTEPITLVAVTAGVGQINGIQLRDITMGTPSTNQFVQNFQYTMPSSYAGSNALMVDSTITAGTLTLASATTMTNLSILSSTGNAANVISYSVQHSSGSPDTGTFTSPNWLSGSGTLMYEAQGFLVTSTSGGGFTDVNAGTAGPCLYGSQITVSGASPVTSVTLTYSSGGGHTCVFALSGNDSGTNWIPLTVTGFDEDMIVEQAVAQPNPFTNFTTATMDNGTVNTGNTFYEVGFNRVAPKTGLPHAGTTFTSISHPNRTYMMAPSFQSLAPDSILVSSNVPSATIVPAVPAAFTAFSVVSAGANIGTSTMSNILIMQHADGVTETNLFLAYDWFATVTVALTNKAYSSVGRFNVNNPGTFNDTLTNDDQLFESTFLLKDTTSPVTNMTIKYGSGPNNCTAYIFAVSATAGGFPPTIATQPQSQEWYPGQTATFTVSLSAGTTPLTNIWLVESNGIYYPLPNGVDGNGSTVSGATTMSMSISGLTMGDGTNYEVIITNAVGSVTSAPALLTINSGTPVGPIIDAQIPAAGTSPTVLTNERTGFSVTIDTTSAPPLSYQWYFGVPTGPAAAIPNATNAKYLYLNTSNTTIFCIISNFVGTATNTPVSLSITNPTAYQAAILAYNPVAYWPLTETSGNIAYDLAGGNNGTYEGGFSLGQPGIPALAGIGTNSSVGLDGATAYVDIPEGNLNITNQMTVIQWIQTTYNQNQFVTSMGHGDSSYRLGFSPQAHGGNGGAHFADEDPDVISPNVINDGNWHQLVGVYDIAGGTTNEYLYVDGQLAASTTAATAPTGSAYDVWIGGAPDYATPGSTRFFDGNTAQVAILTNALTSSQVAGIYYSLGFPPTVSITPANPEVYTNGTLTLTANTTGTPPLAIQWYSVDTSLNSNIIAGATNSVYAVTNPSLSLSGYTYGVLVTNAYGSVMASVVVTVKQPSGVYATTVLADKPIAYWPLDESPDNGSGNNGTPAIDIINGDNGYYTNTVIGVMPNTPSIGFDITAPFGLADSDTNYAEFGQLVDPAVGALADNYVAGINGINFGTPTNTATNFSVEAWVYLNANNVGGAGIVSQGYGSGGEQFAMDMGGGANAFRFYWRDASGATHGNASPSGPPALNTWYQVVGVLCEVSNYVEIFTNGVLAQSNYFATGGPAGLLQEVYPIAIGARQPGAGEDYSQQLSGSVADVAIYAYALSPAQIANHYLSSGILPVFVTQPTNSSVGDGGRVTFYSAVLGSLPISYQWFDSTLNQAIPGATGSNYTIASASYNTLNNEQYYLVASNIYGATTSSVVTLTVVGGAPQVSVDVLPDYSVSFGAPLTISAIFLGTTPLHYQWLYNGAPLAADPRFSGLTSNALTIFPTIVGDSGTYQLLVSNAFGTNYSSMASVTVLPYLTFSTLGAGWSDNVNTETPFGGYIASNVLELTDGNGNEALSSFSSNQVYIGNFAASFTYTVTGGASADGMTFVLQNDPRGAGALGAGGGALGYSSGVDTDYPATPAIVPSVALEFNLYSGATPFEDEPNSISLNTNGYLGDTGTGLFEYTSPVFFNSGDPITVSVNYSNEIASLLMTDPNTAETFSIDIPINIPAVLGSNLAYIGFTGGDGGSTSIQQISNFTFTNYVFANYVNLSVAASGTNLVLSWPDVAGYHVQSIGDLSQSANPAAWQNVAAPVIMTNGIWEVVTPFPAHPQFYRLEFP